jgi:uncharacterized protein (DUF58 family)
MIDQATRKRIKKLEILTKRIMKSALAGDYLSAFKGSGLEFHQIREYQVGDDVRSIDWNSSAKMNKIMVKQFVEERERTVILAIDISGSTAYSSQRLLCSETIADIAGTLAFVTRYGKDNVGALFFSDVVEHWIAPRKGNVHFGKLIEQIFSIKPSSPSTSLTAALKFLIQLKKKNAVVFLLSDFIDQSEEYQRLLKVVACQYDLIALRVLDHCEMQLPDIGLLEVVDSETGTHAILDTRGRKRTDHHNLNYFLGERAYQQRKIFEKYSIDLLDLDANTPFINPLIKFFQQRIRRQI